MSNENQIPTFFADQTTKNLLLNQIPKFIGKKILIVGDIGIDEYIMGEVRRISPEAPVPVLEVEKEDVRLGLAGNVAQNISSLGGTPVLLSVVGDDSGAGLLRDLLRKSQVNSELLIVDSERPTTRKARVMAKHHHIVRVDYEMKKYISPAVEAKMILQITKQIPLVDAVIVEDYAKGLLSENILKFIVKESHQHQKPIYLDPHRSTPSDYYSGVDLIKPNYDEAVVLSGLNHDDLRERPNKVLEVGKTLQKKTGAKQVVMTQGKDGMTIFSGDQVTRVPTYAQQVFDVTGAGDTVIAAITLGLVSGLSLQNACVLANYAAGVVVGQIGCVPCSVAELKDYIENTASEGM